MTANRSNSYEKIETNGSKGDPSDTLGDLVVGQGNIQS
jgi:hypothetical protein